ncbi:unnamed protein product [Trifolium pratense]|uniref:Uncharacterized protein n=1 Tax=Trifolium pratense TaxID=57577 RepID=A0ACB0L5P2_TRIPR|nr:unnamed protein product [Trifolium pratense]
MGDSIKLLVEKLIEGNAKMLLLSKQMYQQTLGLKEEIGRMREEIQKVKEIESESLQNLNDSEQSSEPSNRKLQSHKESMDGLDAAIEKKESDNREVSVKVNQVVVIDSPLSPEPPDVEINTHHVEIKSSGFDQHAKVSSRREPPAKPPDRSLALDMGGYARTDAERRRIQTNLLRPPPSPEPPDTDRLTTALLRQTSLHKTSYLTGGVYEYLCVIALDGEKDPEEIRVKLAFDDKVRLKLTTNELGIILNLKMGQIDKYMPSILPNHKLSHVSSSEQHTSTLLSYESSKAPGMYSTHTMQCELFIMRFIKWAVVGTLKLAQFNCPMIQKEMVIDDPTRDLFGIEVLTTKDFLVGEGLLPITWNSFISEYVQQERYVEVFKYFKKIQCADSHMLLSGNETHEYVRWICVIRDGTTNITAGGDLMNLKLREAISGRVFWFMMLLQCLIGMYYNCDSLIGVRKLFEWLNVIGTISWNSLISNNYVGCENVFIVLKQISAHKFFELSSHTDSRVPLNCCGKSYVPPTNLSIGLETIYYSLELINKVMINCIKQIIKLTSLNRLLGIEENAALTIWDDTNDFDCLLAKDVTDDIYFPLLIIETNCNMAPYDVYRWSEKEEINQGVLCTLYAHGLWYVVWPSKHTVEGLNEQWGVNVCFEELFDLTIVKIMSLSSSLGIIQWDPRKPNIPMLVSTHECGWKSFPSLYSLQNFFYDRGKLCEILFDARNHKLLETTVCVLSSYNLLNLVYDRGKIMLKSIWVVVLMLVYDRGKFCHLSIWVQMMSDLSSFNGLILMCFSSVLKGLLAARRVIETSLNLEDKVVSKEVGIDRNRDKRWALIL